MALLDKIKGLFSRAELPKETQLLLSGVEDVRALRNGLDEIVTRNEVEARDIEREIDKLARMEESHKARIQEQGLTTREKTNVLREIKRLRARMGSFEKRHRIHQDNIDLHLGLFDRITEMEAMEMKRVTQDQISEISADYDERLDKHRDIMATSRAAAGMEGTYEDSAELAELAALEREIMAEANPAPAETAPAVSVSAAPEPVLEAAPEVVEAAPEPEPVPQEEIFVNTSGGRRSIDDEIARLEAESAVEDEEDRRALELE